ncbi:hypothetical protein [uncultured Bifidobacterium sp.]|uniref:hypothetical protein n=1 Tax=uncultured Bifidobacterium sp. TaxID=165187 RepID=UPI00260B0348|nr:hypothetical protein [uncultured Bifidobacterium sp.]
MAARYVQHVHEYHHESTCVDHVIIYAWFAWLPDSMNADELDDAETRTIIWAESQGWELHNKLKQIGHKAREPSSYSCMTKQAWNFVWNREERTINALPTATLPEATVSQRRRYKKLTNLPGYDELLETLALYVRHTHTLLPELQRTCTSNGGTGDTGMVLAAQRRTYAPDHHT